MFNIKERGLTPKFAAPQTSTEPETGSTSTTVQTGFRAVPGQEST